MQPFKTFKLFKNKNFEKRKFLALVERNTKKNLPQLKLPFLYTFENNHETKSYYYY